MSPFGSNALKILTVFTLWRQDSAFDLKFYLGGRGRGYWLKLGVMACFLQCSVEREPQEITRQMYMFCKGLETKNLMIPTEITSG